MEKQSLLDEGAELVETKQGGSKGIYSLKPTDLQDIVQKYLQRTFDEDILHIQNDLKGPEHIAFSIGSHLQNGIASNSERARE